MHTAAEQKMNHDARVTAATGNQQPLAVLFWKLKKKGLVIINPSTSA
jgi:hypothetical protein